MQFRRTTEDLEQITGGRWDSPVALLDSSAASRRQELMGEYGLVEAILREAIHEYQKFAGQQTRRGARLFRDVHQWFLADDREWDFSFINVCQILDLEPTYIRTGLKLWCERQRKQVSEPMLG